jgi:hypothetical protein
VLLQLQSSSYTSEYKAALDLWLAIYTADNVLICYVASTSEEVRSMRPACWQGRY